jgi:hypothetical protein
MAAPEPAPRAGTSGQHTTVGGDTPAGGRQRRWTQEGSATVSLLLGGFGEEREQPVVQRVEAQGPGAGHTSVCHPADRVEYGGELLLPSAEPFRHQRTEKFRGHRVGDRLVGQPAQLLGRARPRGQCVDKVLIDTECAIRPRRNPFRDVNIPKSMSQGSGRTRPRSDIYRQILAFTGLPWNCPLHFTPCPPPRRSKRA